MANISKLFSAELDGIDAKLIEVETDINVGLHSFAIVGLADKSLKEAKERVNSSLKNIGIKPPTKENRRIVVNLAPADFKKAGSQYDLAIAVGYLLASKQLKNFDTSRSIFVGELSLEGKLRPINGALSIADLAKKLNYENIYLPKQNATEAAMVSGIKVIPVSDLNQLIAHLENTNSIPLQIQTRIHDSNQFPYLNIHEVKGQESAKRALTIAAAGGHNLLMSGPPGTGKTMLAQALNSILPSPNLDEVIEITKIYSAAGLLGENSFIDFRPFRSPHQSASLPAVVGGGQTPRPGEISLAHRGVLFLDELPEFRRDILESLRQPLESGKAFISRVKSNLILPAEFILIAAMNPCPCGFYGDQEKECRCAAHEILRYQKKISGPLLDRIDIQINVPRINIEQLRDNTEIKKSNDLKNKVQEVRVAQTERYKNIKKLTNSSLNSKECDKYISLTKNAEKFIKEIFDKSLVSARGYYRILKVAKTIADLENLDSVEQKHLAEAFSYRLKEV